MASSSHHSSRPPSFGRFQVIKELGRGGMGSVYLAEDPALGRKVAIKVIDGDAGAKMRARFAREGEALARLSHRSILRVHEIDETPEGLPFIVMEYLEGQSFDSLPFGQDSFDDIRRDFALFADALAHAHSQSILHRDVKPSNLFRCHSGRVVLLDFGLARFEDSVKHLTLTEENELLGTPSFMAPEQVDGQRASQATDVYGLGASLYHSMTGRAPFVAQSSMKILMSILSESPPAPREINPQVPIELDRLTLSALSKKPEQRPSLKEFKEALKTLEPVASKGQFQWKILVFALALILLLSLSFGAFVPRNTDQETVWIQLKILAPKSTVWREGEKLEGQTSGEGWTLYEVPAKTESLTIRRDGASKVLSLPNDLTDFRELVPSTFQVQLAIPKEMKVLVEDRRGQQLRPSKNNSFELMLGRYQFRASQPGHHDSLRTIDVHKDLELSFQCRQEKRFESNFSSAKAWAQPLIHDLNRDGIKDIAFTAIDQREGVPAANAAFLFAFSGKDGRPLWTFDQFACRWARPSLGVLDRKPCLVISKLSSFNKPEIAFLEPHSGKIVSRVKFAKGLSPGQPVYCELAKGPGTFVAMVNGAYHGMSLSRRVFTIDPIMYEDKYGSFSQIAPLVVDSVGSGFLDSFVLAFNESTHVFQVTPGRPYGYVRHTHWTFSKPEFQTERALLRVFPEDSGTILEVRTGKVELSRIHAFVRIRELKTGKLRSFIIPGSILALNLADVLGTGASQILVSYADQKEGSTVQLMDRSGETLASRRFSDQIEDVESFTDKKNRRFIVVSETNTGVVSILEGSTLQTVWRRKIGKSTRIAVEDLDNDGVHELIAIARFDKTLFVYDPFLK